MIKGTIEEAVEETYRELYLKALDKIDELEKALDKACRELTYDHCNIPKGMEKEEVVKWYEEDWKEWALSDDE